MKWFANVCVAVLLPLPVCAQLGPDFERPSTAVEASYKAPVSFRQARPLDGLPKGRWWGVFDDAVLEELINRSTAESQTLKVAVARFDQARAAARLARSQFFPQLTATGLAERQGTSANMPSPFPLDGLRYDGPAFNTPLEFSWEVDLWGKLRRQSEAGRAEAFAAADAMQNGLLTLHADIAMNYFRLRALDRELVAVVEAIALRKEALNIARARVQAGAGSELEEAQAETELAVATAEVSALRTQRDQLENALAVLVGASPTTFKVAESSRGMGVPPMIPAGVPSDLLERRPDVAQAERQLNAASAEIGVARAAAFPSLRLSGLGGFQSGSLDLLIDSESLMWSVGPQISIPILSGGKNRAATEGAVAMHSQRLAEYRQAVLVAFGEVENSLSAIHHLAKQAVAQDQARVSAERAAELAHTRYEAGTSPYLDVISADRSALEVERGAAQLSGQRMMACVGLIKALGGGWDQTLPVEVPPVEVDEAAHALPERRPGLVSRVKGWFKRAPERVAE